MVSIFTGEAKLVIFGLPCTVSIQDVHTLLESCWGARGCSCGDAQVDLLPFPGERNEVLAIVRLRHGRLQAYRLADDIGARHFQGHSLSSWVPVMAWA